jgi:hypothetical protein
LEHPIFFIHELLLIPTGTAYDARSLTSGPTCQAAECAGSCGGTLAHSRPEGEGGDSDGEEGSKGRKEEGGEEEVTARPKDS